MPNGATKEKETVVSKAREMLEKRLAELQPMVTEAKEISETLDAMNGNPTPTAAPRARRTRSGNGGSGSSAGTGERYEQFLQVIRDNADGIKVADAAKEMGLKNPNYLYRLRDKAVDEGLIKQETDGRLIPVEQPSS